MNYKYLGEAVALLGIAYSLFRWIIRNAPESDRPGPGRIEIDLARLRWREAAGESEGFASDTGRPTAATLPRAGADAERSEGHPLPVSTPAPDPGMLAAAAAMFGVTTDALIAMDPRERALLLSGYRAARTAERRGARRAREGE